MPCMGGPEDSWAYGKTDQEVDLIIDSANKIARDNDPLYQITKSRNEIARLLCSFCQSYLNDRSIPQEVVEWAKSHCNFDKTQGREWPISADNFNSAKPEIQGNAER